jgi:hypothetical protein
MQFASWVNMYSGVRTILGKYWSIFYSKLRGKTLLFEAFLVAISFHVLLLPVLWLAGWMLPWPKGPTITTIIEYDLRNWPNVTKPDKIYDIREPDK